MVHSQTCLPPSQGCGEGFMSWHTHSAENKAQPRGGYSWRAAPATAIPVIATALTAAQVQGAEFGGFGT